jgi:hypothetical protein
MSGSEFQGGSDAIGHIIRKTRASIRAIPIHDPHSDPVSIEFRFQAEKVLDQESALVIPLFHRGRSRITQVRITATVPDAKVVAKPEQRAGVFPMKDEPP